eukprot:CAMPEP_0173217498 /NCGR_PEP_ID=MMETSP1142-20121109/528_1 /TAXON_ID=483371 /ORGANISM="non described non described, Strain CCMP2298" /LENGTH=172 /DNA_ID=CAMNT_0014145083 /DNA_START=93 /DNA_END=611 /DNA_ORIENTATION=-
MLQSTRSTSSSRVLLGCADADACLRTGIAPDRLPPASFPPTGIFMTALLANESEKLCLNILAREGDGGPLLGSGELSEWSPTPLLPSRNELFSSAMRAIITLSCGEVERDRADRDPDPESESMPTRLAAVSAAAVACIYAFTIHCLRRFLRAFFMSSSRRSLLKWKGFALLT